MLKHGLWFVLLISLATPLGACGGGDCVSLCEQAQDGNCTYISSPCDDVCSAVEQIAACEEELDEYVDCLSGAGDVCDSECGSKEINLGACVNDYCGDHGDEQACQDLSALL